MVIASKYSDPIATNFGRVPRFPFSISISAPFSLRSWESVTAISPIDRGFLGKLEISLEKSNEAEINFYQQIKSSISFLFIGSVFHHIASEIYFVVSRIVFIETHNYQSEVLSQRLHPIPRQRKNLSNSFIRKLFVTRGRRDSAAIITRRTLIFAVRTVPQDVSRPASK